MASNNDLIKKGINSASLNEDGNIINHIIHVTRQDQNIEVIVLARKLCKTLFMNRIQRSRVYAFIACLEDNLYQNSLEGVKLG